MQRGQWVVAGVALAVAVGAGAWYGARPESPPPLAVVATGSRPSTAGLTVHVAGAVARPGLVVLPAGARVADAVAGAGGARPDADLAKLNLAAPVADGAQVVVPAQGQAVAEGGAAGPLSLNQATAAELEALPGVGPVTAARIVAHREQHGPFAAVEDLLDIPGIGEGRLAELRDLVSVP